MESEHAAKEVQNVLLKVGIPPNLLGFMYIAYAEELALNDKDYLRNLTKCMYVDIAKKFHTTPSSVERCIRHAISVGLTYGSHDFIDFLFQNSLNQRKGMPTNSQFISRIYFYLLDK